MWLAVISEKVTSKKCSCNLFQQKSEVNWSAATTLEWEVLELNLISSTFFVLKNKPPGTSLDKLPKFLSL